MWGDGGREGMMALKYMNQQGLLQIILLQIEDLCFILEKKYNIKASVISGGESRGYILYVYKSSMANFSKIVKPYMLLIL